MTMMWKRFSDSEAEDRETLAVTAWMKELASLSVDEGPLPDPTYLWWKAELLRRWDAQQKATVPIEVGEQVQVGVGLVAAAALLVWLWRTLPGLTTPSTASMTGGSLSMGLIVSAALIAATAGVMVRDLIRGS
ncbi:MAG: hypothetical protein A3G76_15015 [Acidobacteria bacterium RIFCSPLOWO2_12_FULL_65_11]|nr:MAG: hypothetical protein A3H95_02545 [Acidobacteria bacterium RIFCSPLOWO2_02_FULL_64_15]OFW28961.1 MAG: hypothetical protein A3G76_15015 [Acidobacteria bacterium RIFCSPLOWO2_12_FULL_65_11]